MSKKQTKEEFKRLLERREEETGKLKQELLDAYIRNNLEVSKAKGEGYREAIEAILNLLHAFAGSDHND